MNKLSAIVISTIKGKRLPVMMKSIEQYIPPDVEIYIAHNGLAVLDYHSRIHKMHLVKSDATNFGDAYNFICKRAFEKHESIIVCNDDIVFHPDTYTILNHEYSYLHDGIGNALGWVACRNDFSAGIQNIRWQANGIMEGLKFAHEKTAVETDIIAPICAAIHRDSWIDFLPINWYSDDIQCMMMQEKGMHNIVSTAYVHHVGSQSMQSPEIEIANSLNYIKENHPSYYRKLEQCHLRLN